MHGLGEGVDVSALVSPGAETQFSDLRFLLYSHDSWGLGHLRRSLAIAGALTSRFAGANVLVVTGSPCATQFELPDNCDVLKLPSISKDAWGHYKTRSLSGDVASTIAFRARLILESYRAFEPHVILVDHQVTGLHDEALGMLREARKSGKWTIYGLRDVLDSGDAVSEQWDSPACRWALTRGYDRICVYGQPDVFDPRGHYRALVPVRDKIEFVGYVTTPAVDLARSPVPPLEPQILVTLGGGEDGGERVGAYLEALSLRPAHWTSRIITGPLMDADRVRQLKRYVRESGLTERVKISRFHSSIPRLLRGADAVVGMAGYNSCTEFLQSRVPIVLMPRTHPRQEQLIRARRLQELGLATCLETLDAKAVREAVEQALMSPVSTGNAVRLDGLENFCALIGRMLSGTEPAVPLERTVRSVSRAE